MATNFKSLVQLGLAGPVLALVLPGCGVPQEKFNDQVAKAEKSRADFNDDEDLLKTSKKIIADDKTKLAKLQGDLDAKTKADTDQIGALNAQIADLQKSNKDMKDAASDSKNTLQKKLADTIAEKDAISQKLADLTKTTGDQIADLTTQLAHVQADKDALQREKDEQLAKAKAEKDALEAGLKSEIDKGNIELKDLKEGISLHLGDKVLFASGEAELKPDARKVLDEIGGVLNNLKGKDIRIEGYTDNTPLGGAMKEKYPSNWELSAARATVVARYLQDKVNVDPARLVVTGYGEFRPTAPNDTKENQAKNRHIEIVLIPHL